MIVVLNQSIYLNLFFFINAITLAKICICIRDFDILKINITLLLISKNKLLMQLLLNLKKKDIIITLKPKNNNGFLLLRLKKNLC